MNQTTGDLPFGEQIIYVELDAILDTRLSVAAQLDIAAWKEIAHHPDYVVRDTDDLSLFTQRFTKEQFYHAWDNRDTSCLRDAPLLMTNYVKILRDMSVTLNRKLRDQNDPLVQNIEFVINTYPYELSSDEERAIGLCVESVLFPGTKVSVKRIPYSVMDFAFLRAHLTAWAVYNLRQWLEEAEPGEYEPPGAPQVTVFAPALFHRDGKPTDEQMKELMETEKDFTADDIFGLTEFEYSPVINLTLQDPIHFSIIHDYSKEDPMSVIRPTPPQ